MLNATTSQACPLCHGKKIAAFHEDTLRAYHECQECRLVFVPSCFHLSNEEEKAEYDLHQNNPNDAGYRHFLSRLVTPLMDRLPAQAQGLDFGCGPGPTLSVMLEEAGHKVTLYDKFYAHDTHALEKDYDFITATEVVEHLAQPREELDRLYTLLRPGGILGIMTKQVINQTAFKDWHYKNDRTHISFFSRTTFEWLAARWEARLEFMGADVILVHKGNKA
jgi:2-polyprenyl-3-methyl-5-hydroxy-6-metoxy-1,4-benzoquinol methylase